MQVPCEVRHIEGKGLGVVALEFIAKGTVVWKNIHQGIEFRSEGEFREFLKGKSHEQIQDVLVHCYGPGREGVIHYLQETSEFTNHDPNPNLDDQEYEKRATRDIQAGEEITEDYKTYKKVDWHLKICEEYGVKDCVTFAEKFEEEMKKNANPA